MNGIQNGWVINIGSTAAYVPFSGGISYNTTKSAVHGFSASLVMDLRKIGIRVCNISPGNVFNKDYPCPPEDDWMMRPLDIGRSIVGLLNMPFDATPTFLEIKPTRTPDHPEKGIRSLRYI